MLNEGPAIAGVLRDLERNHPDAERIVVDGGSTDDSVVQAMPLCDQLLIGDPGRARQMNLGARAASGDYLFFLHADSRPSIGGKELDSRLGSTPDWGFCHVRLSGKGALFRVIEWSINRRSQWTSIATGDQMLFVRRTLFLQLGGYQDIPLMEDVALSKQLRALASPVVVPEPVTTSSRRWEEGGTLRTIVLMWVLRLAYACGISPARLWRRYHG